MGTAIWSQFHAVFVNSTYLLGEQADRCYLYASKMWVTCRALMLLVFLASLPVTPVGRFRRPFNLKTPGRNLR